MRRGNTVFATLTGFAVMMSLLGEAFSAKEGLDKIQSVSEDTVSANHGRRPEKTAIVEKAMKMEMPFIANEGQVDERVEFYANTFCGTVFVTEDREIVYSLPNYRTWSRNWGMKELSGKRGSVDNNKGMNNTSGKNTYSEKMRGIILRERFEGGKVSGIRGEAKAITKVNYFRGNDPRKWRPNISSYSMVSLGEVYEGVEVKLKAHGNTVEKMFYVKPGYSPDNIQLSLNGNRFLKINKEGELVVKTELGEVRFSKPLAYQDINGKKVEVSVHYQFLNSQSKIHNQKPRYSFKVAAYDRTRELVIDPLLSSTFLGGSSFDSAGSLILDSKGNVYVTGWTWSSDFPTTTGAYDASFGDNDVFVSKLSSDLTSLLASTYLGGSSYAGSLILDSTGNVYVTGSTRSSNFPTTAGAYDTTHTGDGNFDVFISKLSSGLTILLASTFLGGIGDDYGNSLALDSNGSVYVTGYTRSSDFPTTAGVYDTSSTISDTNFPDIFISRLDGNLSSIGKIYGYIIDAVSKDEIMDAAVKLKGLKTKAKKETSTDSYGFFEFLDLEADTYKLTAKKKGYKYAKKVSLKKGEEEEIRIKMKPLNQ